MVQVGFEGIFRPAGKRLKVALTYTGGGGGDPLRGPMGQARQEALEKLRIVCERADRELDWLIMDLAR